MRLKVVVFSFLIFFVYFSFSYFSDKISFADTSVSGDSVVAKETKECPDCSFANPVNDRYCLNCATEIWQLSEKKLKVLRENNKRLLAERVSRSAILAEKEREYISRRKLFGHYHKTFAKLKNASAAASVTENDLNLLADSIESFYGFKIHHQFNRETFFKKQRINGSGKQSDLKDIVNVLISLESFFNSYPKDLIKGNLEAVYFVANLKYEDKIPAGFASRRSFWISTRHPGGRFTRKEYLSTIHHEFAHILHGNNSFPEKKWLAINDKNFKYSGSGWQLIGQKDANRGGHERNKQGFLIKYNEASIQEDVAVFAEWLFVKEEKLIQLAKKYDKIRKKYKLISAFYKKLGVNFS